MIAEFISSWELFQNAYLTGGLLAIMLSLLGVVVFARDQIFVGAAIAQLSALGIASGLLLAPFVAEPKFHEFILSICGIGAAILATLLTRTDRGLERIESSEVRTGWVFLLGGSLSVVLLSQSPIGRDEVSRLLSSSILGASTTEVWIVSLMAGITVTVFIGFRDYVRLFVIDPLNADAVGVPVKRIELMFSLWLGLAVGMSMKLSGMLFTFGALILPVMLAARWANTVGGTILLAPLIAVLATFVAFVTANHFDLPPGQAAAALLSLAIIPSWLVARLVKRC